MEPKHFHLTLTLAERDLTVAVLRERAIGGDGATRLSIAHRLERAYGEDDILSLATRARSAWYSGQVDDLALDLLGRMLDGTETRAFSEALAEQVDGTDLVIYTHKAKCVLLASDNEDAADEHGAGATLSTEQRAFFALEADIRERLQRMIDYGAPDGVTLPDGFDLEDPTTWTATADEDAADGTATADEKGGAA